MRNVSRASDDMTTSIRWGAVSASLSHQEGDCAQGRFHLAPDRDGRIVAKFRPALPVGVSVQDILPAVRLGGDRTPETNRIAAWDPRDDGSELGTFITYAAARVGIEAVLSGPICLHSTSELLEAHGFHPGAEGHERTRNRIRQRIEQGSDFIRLWQNEPLKNWGEIARLRVGIPRDPRRVVSGGGYDVWPVRQEPVRAKLTGLIALSDRLLTDPHLPKR